jgi:hypothetical protein
MLKQPVSIKYQPSERDFSLGFNFSTGVFPLNHRILDEVSDTNCDLEELAPLQDTKQNKTSLNFELDEGRYGQRFVGSAGEVLFGKKVLNQADGTKITWDWDLYRCRD